MASASGGGTAGGAPALFAMVGRPRPQAQSPEQEALARERAELDAQRARLDLEEQARIRARRGALGGRAALLGGDQLGVDTAESRGDPLKTKLGA